jgi:hypothetical protein
MEKATLIPFSYRGRGSALRSQKTSWLPLESRLDSEVGAGGGAVLVGLDMVEDGFEALEGFEAFLGGVEL